VRRSIGQAKAPRNPAKPLAPLLTYVVDAAEVSGLALTTAR
jgi:hypothetical protein